MPKYQVKIDVADEFTLKDETVKATIRPTYLHGKPLQGKAIVLLTENGCFGNVVKIKKEIDINGNGIVEYNIKNDLKCAKIESKRTFHMEVEFTETLTGVTQSTQTFFNIFKEPYVVDCKYGDIVDNNTVMIMVSY